MASLSFFDSLSFLMAFLTTLLFTPVAGRVARITGILDRPSGLKDHKAPTPYLGGTAIYIGVVLGLMAFYKSLPGEGLQAILMGATIVMLLGLLDDIHAFGPWLKFVFQSLGVLVLIMAGVHLKIAILPLWLNILLTFFWMLAVTNAMNIIDIMDGLASGVAALASIAFCVIAIGVGRSDLAVLAASLSGACLGFLVFNRPPASIFMGDCGSQFLGFTLAAVAMGIGYTEQNEIALFAPLMILAVPVYDLFLVMVIRVTNGRSPFRGSKDHLALRLRFMGFSVRRTILVFYVAAALMGLAAVSVTFVPLEVAAGIYLITVALVLAGTIVVSRVEVPASSE